MTETSKFTVIALEEHYWDPDLVAMFPGREGKRVSDVERRLLDMGELRLREMDEAGIDVQVLSHGAPGTQKLDAETSKRLARRDRSVRTSGPNPSQARPMGRTTTSSTSGTQCSTGAARAWASAVMRTRG